MTILQHQDVFAPYYAGREPDPAREDDPPRMIETAPNLDAAQQRRLRLEAVRRRFLNTRRAPSQGA